MAVKMTKEAPCAAILLAAGLSSRYRAQAEAGASSKLLAQVEGRPLVRIVAEAALASQAQPLIVVTGYERENIEASLAGLPIHFVHNPDYATGMASSLRIGVVNVPQNCAGTIVLLGDMPQIHARLINQLIDHFATHEAARALVPVFINEQGQRERGNPVLLARSIFADIAHLSGDQGARKLLTGAGVVELPVDDHSIALDIDTPQALAQWQSSLKRERA